MKDIHNIENKEIQSRSPENYKQIKPESSINKTEAENIVREKYDDNGDLYRVNNELLPNNEYKINGYIYKTDDRGRIISASGKLQLKDHDNRAPMPDKMDTIGKGDQRASDERGHLIADRFNGSGKLDNLVAMDKKTNEIDFAKEENTMACALENGADVWFKVEPVYIGSSYRPSEFILSRSIDGEKREITFRNGDNKE